MWLEPGDTIKIEHPGLHPRHAPEVELDLAVVNNGAAPLETVSLVATFAQRTAQGRRHRIMERGLHWPARLRPGRSVKWRIEAEGTEVRIDCPLTEKLGTVPPASADTFHELREARLMPVRVHAAMMLAYLGDSRAAAAVGALGPLTALEELARTEIGRTLTPLRACGLQVAHGILSACVHNGTDGLLRGVVVEGEGQGARSWPVEDLFLPGRGLAVELPLEGSKPPERLRVAAGAATAEQPPGERGDGVAGPDGGG